MDFYHVYNRGANKALTFIDDRGRGRFIGLLYLCNTTTPVRFRDVGNQPSRQGPTLAECFSQDRGDVLVHIVAYALMPNHFHIILGADDPANVSKFIQKLSTAYTMYFNKRHEHSGVVFQGKAKKKTIDSEEYFRWLFSYVHLNPIDLVIPDWKELDISDVDAVRHFIHDYAWSSYQDIYMGKRVESAVLSFDVMPDFLAKIDDLEDLLNETRQGPTLA